MSDDLDDLILVSKSGLMNLLGRYAMPPFPPDGETMDCAPLAAELIAAVDAITYAAPGDVVMATEGYVTFKDGRVASVTVPKESDA